MTLRIARAIAATSMVAVVLVATGPAAPAVAQDPEPPARIIVVTVPGLGWSDVTPSSTPSLVALADRGATAALSVKTVGRRTDRAEAYATLSSGTRATAAAPGDVRVWSHQEAVAHDIDAGDAAVVVQGLDAVDDANEGQHRGTEIGALAAALHDGGWATAVIAHRGDEPTGAGAPAVAVAHRDRTDGGASDLGTVAHGTVDVPTDPAGVVAALDELPADDVVVVVEVGDVVRAEGAGRDPAARAAAVAAADETLGAVVDAARPADLILAFSPVAPAAGEEPTPFVVAGPGVRPGSARSATTRRAGYVTLPDIAPTLVARAGAPVPDAMAGTRITVGTTAEPGSGARRLADLRGAVEETRFVDRSAGRFLVTLPIVFAAWTLLVLIWLVLPSGSPRRLLGGFVRWVGLVIAVVPTVTFLVSAASVRAWGQPRWFAVTFGIAAGVAAVIALLARRPRWAAPVAVAAAVWLTQVGDVITGGHLQFDSPLGNSPTVAGRFAGMGNLAFSLLAASTVVLAVGAWELVRRCAGASAALGAAALVLAVAAVVSGAPGLGADVGGLLVLAAVAVVVLALLGGRRLTPGRLVVAATVAVGLLGAATAVDLARPEDDQTHLARFARSVTGDDGADVIIRKLDAAAASFVRSSLVWIVICTVVLGAAVWLLQRDLVRQVLDHRGGRTLVAGAATAGVLGAALNDSGVMVPAMMATVFVPLAVWLLVAPDRAAP